MKLRLHRIAVLLLVMLMAGLSGCSTFREPKESTLYPSWEWRKKEILTWAASEKTKVDQGTLTQSEYWQRFYRKSIEMRPDLDDFLFFAGEMIKISRIFEEGRITREQLEDKYRMLADLLAQEEDRRARRLTVAATYITENNEAELFYAYRGSVFLDYSRDLRLRLLAAGPQCSMSHCDFFGGRVQCTPKDPPY